MSEQASTTGFLAIKKRLGKSGVVAFLLTIAALFSGQLHLIKTLIERNLECGFGEPYLQMVTGFPVSAAPWLMLLCVELFLIRAKGSVVEQILIYGAGGLSAAFFCVYAVLLLLSSVCRSDDFLLFAMSTRFLATPLASILLIAALINFAFQTVVRRSS